MPYTPPSQQSPAQSKHASPALSRSSSCSEDGPRLPAVGRPSPPRSTSSTSYLHRQRRSPSIKSDGAPPTPTEMPDSDNTAAIDFAPNGSLTESPISAKHHMIPHGAMILSPPDSSENSDDNDNGNTERGRELATRWDELQEAVRGINQKRESSPEKPGVARTGVASEPVSQSSSPTALSKEARKISHSRSSTELYIPSRASFESPINTSDDSDEENGNSYNRPNLIRKKSGELVKPALRPSSRRRYSSMPGTPTYSKTVHFNDSDNQTRHFLQVDKPIAVSAGTSPVETYDSESEFPIDGDDKAEREIKLSNFPTDAIHIQRRMWPVRVERIFLSPDKNTLIGVCAVQNISFQKLVVARFTLDYWKTTSEVVAEYNNDPTNKPTDGCDRFNFNIKLSDHKNIEEKTLLVCVRYSVSGQEFWDNNNGGNYQIDFTKAAKKPAKSPLASGLGARPLNAIPRSRHTPPASSRPRPESLDDDFAARIDRESNFSLPSADNILGEPQNSIKLKQRGRRGNLFSTATESPPSNGLGGRYDFGASLSAALTQAQEKINRQVAPAKDKDSANKGGYFGPIDRIEGPAKAEERPDAITTDRPAIGSDQYKDLVQKFCYFTPAATGKQSSSPPQPGESTKSSGPHTPVVESTDGAAEYYESVSSSTTDSGTSSPLMMGNNRGASPVRSPFASGSTSPAPITGGGMGGRAASPISFGYPYHAGSRDGYLSDSAAPTAIQG